MKKRYIYSLLFGIPGCFIAATIAFIFFGITAGAFWIFIFGDNPWPAWTERLLPILFVLTFLFVWMALILMGYFTGKRLEADPILNPSHILISGGLTFMFVIVILLQQFRTGNAGSKSDSALCSDYCSRNGYAASGLPSRDSGDRTCSCYDSSGNAVIKILLDDIDPNASK